MITLTLNQIKEHSPCTLGWKRLVKSKPNLERDKPFPFVDIIESNGIKDAIWALRCLDDDNLCRLFAVSCAQDVLHLMDDQRSIDTVKIAHLYAYGESTAHELRDASSAAAVADASSAAAVAAAYAAAYASSAAATASAASDADATALGKQEDTLRYLCKYYEDN